jgi:hypothetical protein
LDDEIDAKVQVYEELAMLGCYRASGYGRLPYD